MVEYQRLSHNGILRESTLQISEYKTYDGKDIGIFIYLIGKGGGGKSHVLDSIITTLFQRHVWSMPNIMLSTTTEKSAYLINASNIFHLDRD